MCGRTSPDTSRAKYSFRPNRNLVFASYPKRARNRKYALRNVVGENQ